MSEKILYLARHAKSSWRSDAQSDFDRPLSKRGRDDAARVAKALRNLGWQPDTIISSPAIRAKQTCRYYAEALGFTPNQVIWNNDIYHAYTITLLHLLSRLPDDCNHVMLVGHNPAMEDLLYHLCGEESARVHMQNNGKLLTTANVVKIVIDVAWKDLVMCDALLDQFLRPKELRKS
jgi:phosphohistidine phosphatase